jgi:predicted dehydrogenase
MALWFFGDFQVEAASLKSIIGGAWEDAADFEVKKSRLTGHFRASWCMENYRLPSFGLSVRGSRGAMEVNDYSLRLELKEGSPRTWFRHDLDDHVPFLLGESEYYREDGAFVDAVFSGVTVEPNFTTALQVDRIIDQVKKKGM